MDIVFEFLGKFFAGLNVSKNNYSSSFMEKGDCGGTDTRSSTLMTTSNENIDWTFGTNASEENNFSFEIIVEFWIRDQA